MTAIIALTGILALPAAAQEFGEGAMDRGQTFPLSGGETIFRGICQGCHMPDADGATGAGSYPALAKNKKLEIAGYPIALVLRGQKAMPGFADMLSDRQIADVINYVRTHFGNKYHDSVTPEDVKSARE